MKVIAIIGASGFIGRHLILSLLISRLYKIKVLSRSPSQCLDYPESELLEIFYGDLDNPDSLSGFLDFNCIVINLIYLWGDGEEKNLLLISNLLAACKKSRIARLVHCSTAAVYGRVSSELISEKNKCFPISEYGVIKLQTEKLVLSAALNNFEAVILRPTSVYGIGGEPLKKMVENLRHSNKFKNYLKSCLFGMRSMNLVHVDNVVSAIFFLSQYPGKWNGDVFNVSDDDDPNNNFAFVENTFMLKLRIPDYSIPRISLPLIFLKIFLIIFGRNNVNPKSKFLPYKLVSLGFNRPISLDIGLHQYINWYYQNSCINDTFEISNENT